MTLAVHVLSTTPHVAVGVRSSSEPLAGSVAVKVSASPSASVAVSVIDLAVSSCASATLTSCATGGVLSVIVTVATFESALPSFAL